LAFVVFNAARSRQNEREKEQFMVRMLAHELRTPAAGIQLALRDIESEFPALSARGQEALLRLQGAQGRLNGVLEASTHYVKSGLKLGNSSERCFVNESIRSCVGWDEGSENCEISLHLLESDLIAARIDPFWLLFCLSNIVDNARKHGRPPISILAKLDAADKKQPVVTISVRDGGSGMTGNTQLDGNGLGIGLSLVQGVLRNFGSKLILENNPTAVTLVLGIAK
jgi:signal transduction histidine kinase